MSGQPGKQLRPTSVSVTRLLAPMSIGLKSKREAAVVGFEPLLQPSYAEAFAFSGFWEGP